MNSSLVSLLKRQKLYNQRIRNESSDSRVEWTKTYLLGLVSEVDEVLRELAWKRHRRNEIDLPNPSNIAYELADLTKYILSLWELWEFSAEDIITFCDQKSSLLEKMWFEDKEKINTDLVVITDLDGTVADWRTSFRKFLLDRGLGVRADRESTMNIEVEFSLGFDEYNSWKNEFESEGGYANLVPYYDAINFLRECKFSNNAYLIAFTARPFHKHKRIWSDTWKWINEFDLPISQLHSGSDSRIMFALDLMKNHKVIMLEDDPQLILRAAQNGIKVIAKNHSYNKGIEHENALFVDQFEHISVMEFFS